MRRIWGLGVVLAVGCSADLAENEGDIAPSTVTTGVDSDPDTGLFTTPLPETDLFSVNLAFSLVGGQWEADPAVRVDLYSPGVELVCSHVLTVGAVTEEAPPAEEPIVAWWAVELGEGVPDLPCADWPARTWRIGLGAYDARLDPAMAARDMLDHEVYGLYLQEDPGAPVYVIGIAGTPEMLAGTTDLTVESPPLPDGPYDGFSLVTLTLGDGEAAL